MISPIETVSNYCNRWCQRCPFTDGCDLMTTSDGDHGFAVDDQVPVSFPALSGPFSDYLVRLEGILDQYGHQLGKLGYGVNREFPFSPGLSVAQLKVLAKKVSRLVRRFEEVEWLRPLLRKGQFERPEVQAVRTLAWYLPMIAPNYRRSIPRKHMSRYGKKHRPYVLNARLTHLALARTIAAITILLECYEERAFDDLFLTLCDCLVLLAGIRELFPDVYRSRRPGFDDPGERQRIFEFFGGFPPLDPFEDGTWSPGGRPPST